MSIAHYDLFEKFAEINPNFDFSKIKADFNNYDNAYRNNKSTIANNFTTTINKWTCSEIQSWLGVLNGSTDINKQLHLSEIISIVRRAVFLTYGFELRDVQLFAVIRKEKRHWPFA